MAHLGQRPQSTPHQLFPLNPCCTHPSFEASRGPPKGTGVSSSPKLSTAPHLRKKDVDITMLRPKATTSTRKAALDSLRDCSGTMLQHERQFYSKELSPGLASQRATFMSPEPEPGCNLSRYELNATMQPRQMEDEESGNLHLVSNSSSLNWSCSQASDSNATISCSEETIGRSLMKDILSPGRVVSDNSLITTSDDCRGIQGNTEKVLKQHGGQKRMDLNKETRNKHHHGIHVQSESLGPVSGAKPSGHQLLFFPEATVKSNMASLNGNCRLWPSHPYYKSTRYSSVVHRHSDMAYRLSISRSLKSACKPHSDTMLFSSRHLKHDYSGKEADENRRSDRSQVNLCTLPISSRLPAHKDAMLVKGCTIGKLISNMEPYKLARPHMSATKLASPSPTERRDHGINPDGGDDHDHGNANISEKEQEDKYDYDNDDDDEEDDDSNEEEEDDDSNEEEDDDDSNEEEDDDDDSNEDDDDDSNEEDYDDFDEMFNMQPQFAELTQRHQRVSLSPTGLPYINYAGNVGDNQEPQPLKRKVNLRRGPLTKNSPERTITTSTPRVHTEECEQSDLINTDVPAGHEGKPLSEQMMKEYFRQLKLTICSSLEEEKFVDELIIRNVKACSLYDRFSNVKLATNRQGSDGRSSISSRHDYSSATDGEAESLTTFQADEEPRATKSDIK